MQQAEFHITQCNLSCPAGSVPGSVEPAITRSPTPLQPGTSVDALTAAKEYILSKPSAAFWTMSSPSSNNQSPSAATLDASLLSAAKTRAAQLVAPSIDAASPGAAGDKQHHAMCPADSREADAPEADALSSPCTDASRPGLDNPVRPARLSPDLSAEIANAEPLAPAVVCNTAAASCEETADDKSAKHPAQHARPEPDESAVAIAADAVTSLASSIGTAPDAAVVAAGLSVTHNPQGPSTEPAARVETCQVCA